MSKQEVSKVIKEAPKKSKNTMSKKSERLKEADPELKQALLEEKEKEGLLRRIEQDDTQAIIEFLRKYCGHRGYTE